MIITRTPLRISLGGGGTDLPAYYREREGFLVAAAIKRYIYVAVNENFDGDLLLKYSETERVDAAAGVRHPLLREALLVTGIDAGIEISSMADIPAGTGLGSSGAFTVGVLKALRAYQREWCTNTAIAELACQIEIERLAAPVGKQDQYATAVGGLNTYRFRPDESVAITPLRISPQVRSRFEENLLLFYTGLRRSAADEFKANEPADVEGSQRLIENLDAVKCIGYESARALEAGDLAGFASLMREQWILKYERQPSGVHDQVDQWIRTGTDAGGGGGKLIGAGGGGFLLFLTERPADLRVAMAELSLREVNLQFDYQGSSTLVDA